VKRHVGLFSLLAGYWFLTTPVLAVTSVSISNVPIQVDQDDEVILDVSLVCTSCSSDSFLRGVFYPNGTSYFGFTQNKENSWINAPAAGCSQYYKVLPTELTEGSWSGRLKVKIDKENSYYAGPGEYIFKVGRYTASCNSPTWSQEITIAVVGPPPTATATLAPSTPTPTPSPMAVAHSPTPTKMSTPSPIKTTTPTLSISAASGSGELIDEDHEGVVLGDVTSAPLKVATTSVIPYGSPLRVFGMATALMAAGFALLSGALVWQRRHGLQDK
jgi:hypothetical protein